MPRTERCSLARPFGLLIAPRMLGSEWAGSEKYKIAAMMHKIAMIPRTAAAATLPVDRPPDCRAAAAPPAVSLTELTRPPWGCASSRLSASGPCWAAVACRTVLRDAALRDGETENVVKAIAGFASGGCE